MPIWESSLKNVNTSDSSFLIQGIRRSKHWRDKAENSILIILSHEVLLGVKMNSILSVSHAAV